MSDSQAAGTEAIDPESQWLVETYGQFFDWAYKRLEEKYAGAAGLADGVARYLLDKRMAPYWGNRNGGISV